VNNHVISVIIPTYQHAEVLGSCIDSILNQSFRSFEIIVVNDGSTDHTLKVLDKYHGKIKVINQDNQGSNFARNRGLTEATGEYVIFCDADVILEKKALFEMYNALRANPSASIAYSKFKFGWKTFHPFKFNAEKLIEKNYIHTTSLVRKKDFPGFDTSVKRLQDWDVWLTMLENKKSGVLIDEVLFKVRIHGTSRIGSSWLPSLVYKIPWNKIRWVPNRIIKYNEAHDVIRKKHNL
jgi:glycosyltransferase involved in cell wall biosynthesis